MSGPSQGTPVGDSDWNENDHSSTAARSATSREVSSSSAFVVAASLDGEAVRREDDVRVGPAHAVGEQVDEAGVVAPALDEGELGAPAERVLELPAVAADRERRVVRREHEPDDRPRAGPSARSTASPMCGCQCFIPVHTGIASSRSSARPRLLGDRVQRRALLDPEPPVALDELGEPLGLIGRPPRMSA